MRCQHAVPTTPIASASLMPYRPCCSPTIDACLGVCRVGCVKALYLVLLAFSLCLTVVGTDKKSLTKEESAKVIEAAIRKSLNKPIGELTKADLEKVRELGLLYTAITDAGLKEVAKAKPKAPIRIGSQLQLFIDHFLICLLFTSPSPRDS